MLDSVQRSDSSAPVAIDIRRFPWVRKLAGDYAFDFAFLAPFFIGDPSQPRAWHEAIARVRARGLPRDPVADLLTVQQARRGAPTEAREAVDTLRDAKGVAVVTGQQAGLFGGPLFTLLKALTALKLAETIRTQYGTAAVAIFWVEAEDHDWHEVASCTVLDGDFQEHTVTLSAPPQQLRDAPVASVTLDDAVEHALQALEVALPPSEFTTPLLASLRTAYCPGHGMADAFARWLETLLGGHGLIVYDASDPASKPLVKEVFARECEFPDRTSGLAAEAGAALVARGYHAQVTPQEGPALFHLDGQRQPIRRDGNDYVVGEARYPASALKDLAAQTPTVFSPSVLLRPIVQDALFPTAGYVAGPSELAYLAQLRKVYEHFDLPMPLLYPRVSATLLDSSTARFLARYDLSLESLRPQDEATLNRLLESQIPPSLEAAFQETARTLDEQLTAVMTSVSTLDPTLEGAVQSTAGKMRHDLHTLHSKMIRAAKRRNETLRRQFDRARAQAFPDGSPQDRAIGSVSFLARYGPALIDRLYRQLPLDLGHHWVVSP